MIANIIINLAVNISTEILVLAMFNKYKSRK